MCSYSKEEEKRSIRYDNARAPGSGPQRTAKQARGSRQPSSSPRTTQHTLGQDLGSYTVPPRHARGPAFLWAHKQPQPGMHPKAETRSGVTKAGESVQQTHRRSPDFAWLRVASRGSVWLELLTYLKHSAGLRLQEQPSPPLPAAQRHPPDVRLAAVLAGNHVRHVLVFHLPGEDVRRRAVLKTEAENVVVGQNAGRTSDEAETDSLAAVASEGTGNW